MISVVDENMIIGTAIHNLPTATCKGRSIISKDYGKKVVGSNMFSSIILHAQQEYPPHELENHNSYIERLAIEE